MKGKRICHTIASFWALVTLHLNLKSGLTELRVRVPGVWPHLGYSGSSEDWSLISSETPFPPGKWDLPRWTLRAL